MERRLKKHIKICFFYVIIDFGGSMKIIKIGAMWCPACLITNKHLDKIKEEYNIEIESLDYDFDEDEVSKYNVGETLPVLVFIENDIEVDRLIGEKKYEDIEGIISKYEKN